MSKTRLKTSSSIEHLHRKSSSTDYFFQPILSANDQRKPPSPFQTGLRYLKFLGQIKRQNDKYPLKSLNNLERTSAFSTNYYAPLPPLSSHLTHKSIQVDDIDDLSYKTAIHSNIFSFSFSEFSFFFLSISFFILFIIFHRYSSHPIHCLFHKKFWYPIDFSHGFPCEHSNIEIHYFEIDSIIYQIELEKTSKTFNCLNMNILSCLPIDYLSVPKGQIIRRNNQLSRYCHQTSKIHCSNQTLTILPYQTKWNLKNNQIYPLNHCSCLTNLNQSKCFHLMITEQCDLQIPLLDYCLKYSRTQSTCQAYIKNE